MGHVYNMTFSNLSTTHLMMLERMGVMEGRTLHHTRRLLPMIDWEAPPAEVLEIIQALIDGITFEEGDVVIAYGTPDVAYYLVTSLMVQRYPPRVIMPLGKNTGAGFRLFGFREIVTAKCEDCWSFIYRDDSGQLGLICDEEA